ncbi:MAG: hypothetical protein KGO92_00795 [Bacteroidota bacterium]|nr:hypothetical protein [Bacteroidota bacterium]
MKQFLRYTQAVFYILAGLNHFRSPSFYLGMIPPYLPWHGLINLLAGIAETLLGISLLIPATRKWGAYGIILLLILFIPVHIYFIQIGNCLPNGFCVPAWVGWLRLLVIHPLLIAWAYQCRK